MAVSREMTSIVPMSLFTFGTNLWAVNSHLSDPAAMKAAGISADQMSYIGLLGVTEAGQAFTLGGLLATVAAALRVIAEWRSGAHTA